MIIMKRSYLIFELMFLFLPWVGAQNQTINPNYQQRVEQKVSDIKQHVLIDSLQEIKLKGVYVNYCLSSDSVLADQNLDKNMREAWQRKINRRWMSALMQILKDNQRVIYLTYLATPEAKIRTEVNMKILRDGLNLTEDELIQRKKEVFDYYVKEQIIIQRDLYDPQKKSENLKWLRSVRPSSVREGDVIKELKASGQLKDKIDLD